MCQQAAVSHGPLAAPALPPPGLLSVPAQAQVGLGDEYDDDDDDDDDDNDDDDDAMVPHDDARAQVGLENTQCQDSDQAPQPKPSHLSHRLW